MEKRRHHTVECSLKRVRRNMQRLPEDLQRIKEEKMKWWKEVVQDWYPRLNTNTYFVPPFHFNRVPFTTHQVHNVAVKVQEPVRQLSDVREGEALQRVQHVLFRLLGHSSEARMVLWRMDFDSYLNHPRGSAAPKKRQHTSSTSKHLLDSRQPSSSPPQQMENSMFVRPRDLGVDYQRGRFDLLIISKKQGLIVGDIKAMGDLMGSASLDTAQELDVVCRKLRKSLAQLNKEEEVLHLLLEDLHPRLPVTKVLFLPNLRRDIMIKALEQDLDLQEEFSFCFGTDWTAALSKCVFSHQLPPVGKAWDVHAEVIRGLKDKWWTLLTAGKRQPLSDHVYHALVARFCGPATLYQVPTSSKAHADVNTLHDAVLLTAHRMGDIVLNQAQLSVVQSKDSSLFVTGPPGTGKTEVLVLKTVQWLQEGHHVYLLVLWQGSHAVSHHIAHRARHMLKHDPSSWQRLHLLISKKGDVSSAVDMLAKESQTRGQWDYKCCDPKDSGYSHNRSVVRDGVNVPWDELMCVRKGYRCVDSGYSDSDCSFVSQNMNLQNSWSNYQDCITSVSPPALEVHSHYASPESMVLLHDRFRGQAGPPALFRNSFRDGGPSRPILQRNSSDGLPHRHSEHQLCNRQVQIERNSETILLTSCGMNGHSLWTDCARPDSASQQVNGQTTDSEILPHRQNVTLSSNSESLTSCKCRNPSSASKSGPMTEMKVIIDEAPWFLPSFVQMLDKKELKYSLWAASCYRGVKPRPMKEATLMQSVRCPPVVVREIEQGSAYSMRAMPHYTFMDMGALSSMPPQTDGPPVKMVWHSQHGHSGDVWDCFKCGVEVASFLKEELRIGSEKKVEGQTLQFSDVLISGHINLPHHVTSAHDTDTNGNTSPSPTEAMETMSETRQWGRVSGFLQGLRDEKVPFRIYHQDDAEALAEANDQAVQVALPETAVGMERVVVVVVGTCDVRNTFPRYVDPWLDVVSCCVSQLVVVRGDVEGCLHHAFHSKLSMASDWPVT